VLAAATWYIIEQRVRIIVLKYEGGDGK